MKKATDGRLFGVQGFLCLVELPSGLNATDHCFKFTPLEPLVIKALHYGPFPIRIRVYIRARRAFDARRFLRRLEAYVLRSECQLCGGVQIFPRIYLALEFRRLLFLTQRQMESVDIPEKSPSQALKDIHVKFWFLKCCAHI